MIVGLLLATSPVYGQMKKPESIDGLSGNMYFDNSRKIHSILVSLKTENDLQLLDAKVEWTINEKPVVFKYDPNASESYRFIMNVENFKYSGDEIRVFERGIDIIDSIFKRSKVQMNEQNYTFKMGENKLSLDIKTGTGNDTVLGIRLIEWIINRKHLEFTSDAEGHIIVKNVLSDDENKLVELSIKLLKDTVLSKTKVVK